MDLNPVVVVFNSVAKDYTIKSPELLHLAPLVISLVTGLPVLRGKAVEMEAMPESDTRDLDPTQWLDRYGDYLFRYAVKRVRDPEAAEEVVQETFLAGLRAQGQYAGRGEERAWLLGILKRKIIDLFRARQRQAVLSAQDAGEDLATLLFDQRGHWKSDTRLLGGWRQDSLERSEFWEALRRCLARLPQRQADVFSLREIDDQSSAEICKGLNISPSNLWVLLHRARLGLAKCLSSS